MKTSTTEASDIVPSELYKFTVAVFQLNYTGSTVGADTVELGPYSDSAIATVPEDGMHTPVMLECWSPA